MSYDDDTELVEILYYATVHETDAAYLLMLGDQREVWIPKSLISQMDDRVFYVPEWFAEKEELN